MHNMIRILMAFSAWLLSIQAHSQAVTPLFAAEEPLTAVLSAPLYQMIRQKDQDSRLYMDGKWAYKLEDGNIKRLDLKVRSRGNFRRVNCDLPPLRLNFRKKALAGTVYDGQNKLKMVGPCGRSDKYQQLVYVEYLSYKLFELLSDYHFKVRLVDVSYADTDQQYKPWISTNFLIEDVGDMAARYQRKEAKLAEPLREDYDLGQTALVELFQLMIGNTDYSTLRSRGGEDCCHNGKLINLKDHHKGLIPVPYDFDSSGIVNAPYAEPPANLPIKRVRSRFFTGWCKQDHHFMAAIEHVSARREQAMALFQEFEPLTPRYRKSALGYLEDFYKMIDDPGTVEKKILERCRGEVITDKMAAEI